MSTSVPDMAPLPHKHPVLGLLSLEQIEQLPLLNVRSSSSRFYQYDHDGIIKVSRSVDRLEHEATTLRQIKHLTRLDAVPHVIDSREYRRGHERYYCLLMERKHGVPLEEAWEIWDDEQRAVFWSRFSVLRDHLAQFRSDRVSAVDGSPAGDKLFDTISDPSVAGPFPSEGAFVRGIMEALARRGQRDGRSVIARRLLHGLLSKTAAAASPSSIVAAAAFSLSHGDLANSILVADPQEEDGVEIVGLVGWRQSGFYPAWWETTKIFVASESTLAEVVATYGGHGVDVDSRYASAVMHAYDMIY